MTEECYDTAQFKPANISNNLNMPPVESNEYNLLT